MSELERWEARFATPEYVFGKAPNAFLKSRAHLLRPGQQALSIADGEGRNGVFLAEQGLDVLAIDASPSALAKAQALAHERGVRIRTERADVETYEWPAQAFDVVVGIFFQFVRPERHGAVFSGIKRALKPGGLLLIQGYRPEQLTYKTGGPAEVERLYTKAMLTEAFGDMSSLDITEHDSEINEGTRHIGMAALIDLVARK
jgi:cyclopropane fatty-acyl-phospholipid synthase-like methyltransferase